MQVPYKISASLSEYDSEVKAGRWKFPTFRDCCAICKGIDCAIEYGFYDRGAFTEDNKLFISDLPMKRYRCMKSNKKIATFSLLPTQLIPYRKYTIRAVSSIMDTWRKYKQRLSQTLKNIFHREEIDDGLCYIDNAHLYEFIEMFKDALRKYKIWRRESYTLEEFITHCSGNNYYRAELVGIRYYKGNGGYLNNSHFLFGQASQFRMNPG